MVVLMMGLTFTACSSDNDDNDINDQSFKIVTTTPVVDDDTYPANTTAANYSDKAFGQVAIEGCVSLVNKLEGANAEIASSKLTEAQEAYLRKVLETIVVDVCVEVGTRTTTLYFNSSIRTVINFSDILVRKVVDVGITVRI